MYHDVDVITNDDLEVEHYNLNPNDHVEVEEAPIDAAAPLATEHPELDKWHADKNPFDSNGPVFRQNTLNEEEDSGSESENDSQRTESDEANSEDNEEWTVLEQDTGVDESKESGVPPSLKLLMSRRSQ